MPGSPGVIQMDVGQEDVSQVTDGEAMLLEAPIELPQGRRWPRVNQQRLWLQAQVDTDGPCQVVVEQVEVDQRFS
jgi:hypothetical protein